MMMYFMGINLLFIPTQFTIEYLTVTSKVIKGFYFARFFYFDIGVIFLYTLMIYKLREVELDILITIKVLKNVDDMSDREMFHEYEKMRKQSYLVKKMYRSWYK